MAFSVTGDFRTLQRIIAKLDNVDEAIDTAFEETRVKAKEFTDDSFGKRQDPYGKAWKPWSAATLEIHRKWPARRSKALLENKSKLRRSIRVVRRGMRLVWFFGTPYGHFHQRGSDGGYIPRRSFIPIKGRGLPGRWKRGFVRTFRRVLREHFD